jgi:6-phosphogluconolactonase
LIVTELERSKTYAFVGTFTTQKHYVKGSGAGIYVYEVEPNSGSMSLAHVVRGVVNPTFLALDAGQRFLYAVNDLDEASVPAAGTVSAFAVDSKTGALAFLNRQPSHGVEPCYATVDNSGRYLLIANYRNGSIAAYPIAPDGSLHPASHVVQHQGSSVHPVQQLGPHVHAIDVLADSPTILSTDKGLDRIIAYRLDLDSGRFVSFGPGGSARPGSGPRHAAYDPQRKRLYVISEILPLMTGFDVTPETGELREVSAIPTIPSDFTGPNFGGHVDIAPSGRFVYGSNRGHDSITIFEPDPETGRLTTIAHQPTGGKTPRHFAIDRGGRFLFVANQNSDAITTFRVDPDTGMLAPTGQIVDVPNPCCIKIATFTV